MPSEWAAPLDELQLGDDEVHVWRVMLNQPDSVIEMLRQLLTPDERERAGRFYCDKDRHHFTVARGVLRTILGLYLNTEPGQIRFCYSEYGKPSLADAQAGDRLRFNLSHSRGLALMAFTLNRELGIDLELVRSDLAGDEIAERFFSPAEVVSLQALSSDQRLEGFFNCWTRKEAYIKAIGEGLSMPLNQFDVSLIPGEPARLLETRKHPIEARRWSLRELKPGSNYIGAVAVEGHDWHLRCWEWLTFDSGTSVRHE
jgi:4'-phosphopantetheinyl transferase